jgi:transcriptional regulator of acetoin/glycerol metabolism
MPFWNLTLRPILAFNDGMAGRKLEATLAAVREWRQGRNITRIARKYGIARNTLWRAIKQRQQARAG